VRQALLQSRPEDRAIESCALSPRHAEEACCSKWIVCATEGPVANFIADSQIMTPVRFSVVFLSASCSFDVMARSGRMKRLRQLDAFHSRGKKFQIKFEMHQPFVAVEK